MGFYAVYKAVFDAVKIAVEAKSSIKTVVLGEQFTFGAFPKVVINAEPSPVSQAAMGGLLEVKVRGSVILVIREYAPKDWFTDVISVMGDVVDAILADRTLGGVAFDCYPTGFSPGEIRFTEVEDKLFYGGIVRFEAVVHYEP
jgi:hypothetical protein